MTKIENYASLIATSQTSVHVSFLGKGMDPRSPFKFSLYLLYLFINIHRKSGGDILARFLKDKNNCHGKMLQWSYVFLTLAINMSSFSLDNEWK